MLNKRKFKNAAIWAIIDVVGRQVINFSISIAIARLLTPVDFGEIAVILFILSIGYITADLGVSYAIQNEKNIDNIDYNSSFWVTVLSGVLFIAILNIISKSLGKYFHIHEFSKMIRYISIPYILLCAQIVPFAKASRELNIRLIVVCLFISTGLSGLVTILFAYNNYGKISLIIQYSVNSIISFFIIIKIIDWNIFGSVSIKRYINLKNYGLYIYLAQLLDTSYTRGYSLLIGGTYSAKELGIFNKAESLGTYFYGLSSQVISRIAFPILSAVKNKSSSTKIYIEKGVYISLLINAPLLLFLHIASYEIVLILFGSRWIEIVPLISIAAIGYIFYPTNVLMINSISSGGNSKLFLMLEFIKKIISIIIIIGLIQKNDILLLVYGYTIATLVSTIINYIFVCNMLNIKYSDILIKLRYILIACIFPLILCNLVKESNIYISLLYKLIIYFTLYIILMIFDKKYIKDIIYDFKK